MKNKTKKFLAGACLGLVGMGCLTGCSAELTEAQRDKIMTVVDSSDTFMKESIDLLKQNNEKLDKERAFGLLKLGVQRLKTNAENVLDNLTIAISQDENVFVYDFAAEKNCSINYFKASNGKRYLYTLEGTNTIKNLAIGNSMNETLEIGKGLFSSVVCYMDASMNIFEVCLLDSVSAITIDSIVNYSELENGNYLITYFIEQNAEISNILSFVEVSKDGYLVKASTNALIDDGDYMSANIVYEFKYNSLVESDVLALVSAN